MTISRERCLMQQPGVTSTRVLGYQSARRGRECYGTVKPGRRVSLASSKLFLQSKFIFYSGGSSFEAEKLRQARQSSRWHSRGRRGDRPQAARSGGRPSDSAGAARSRETSFKQRPGGPG